jgi:hypothetical protein
MGLLGVERRRRELEGQRGATAGNREGGEWNQLGADRSGREKAEAGGGGWQGLA